MRRFRCQCGHVLFFDNGRCLHCGRDVGFDPARLEAVSLERIDDSSGRDAGGRLLRRCRNSLDYGTAACNWLLDDHDPQGNGGYCRACRLNEVVPNLSVERGRALWMPLEAAKRRLLFSLLRLDLPCDDRDAGEGPPLRFRFLEDQRSNPNVEEEFVATGHANGVITVNAAEADPVFLEQQRSHAGQAYRTVLGHMRHEVGHYYFLRLVLGRPMHDEWRMLFGDERADYAQAMEAFYADRAQPRTTAHISDYARSHPHEDWAECFTHVLHMAGALETAADFGITEVATSLDHFDDWVAEWPGLGVMINELNRSLGLDDAHPFTYTEPVLEKLHFVVRAIRSAPHRAAGPS